MPGGIYKSRVTERPSAYTDAALQSKIRQPGVDIVAHPTDPYVHTFADNGTEQILKSLSQLVKSGGALGAIGASEAKEDAIRRTAAAGNSRGVDAEGDVIKQDKLKPEPGVLGKVFSSAFIDGYDKVNGSFHADQMHIEMNDYLLRNANLHDTEFKQGLSAIRQKWTGGMASDAALDGFLPKAMSADEDILKRYSEHQSLLAADVLATKTVSNIRSDLNSLVLSPMLSKLGMTPADLHTEVGIIKLLNNKKEIEAAAPAFRQMLDKLQRELAPLYSTAQVTEMFYPIVEQWATENGIPEALLFTHEKGEAGGISVRDANDPSGKNYGSRIAHASVSAEQTRNSRLDQLVQIRHRAEKEDANTKMVNTLNLGSNLFKSTNPDDKMNYIKMLDTALDPKQTPGITYEQGKALYALRVEVEHQGQHKESSNEELVETLWKELGVGSPTLLNSVIAYKDDLSVKDYHEWLGRAGNDANQRHKAGIEKNDEYFTNKKVTEDSYKHLREWYDPTHPYTGMKTYPVIGAKRLREAERLMQTLYKEEYTKTGGKSPGLTRTFEIEDQVKAKIEHPSKDKEAADRARVPRKADGTPDINTFKDLSKYFGFLTAAERIAVDKSLKARGIEE